MVADNVEPAQFVASKSAKDPLNGKATYRYCWADKVKSLKLAKSIKDLALETFISVVTVVTTKGGGIAVTLTGSAYKACRALLFLACIVQILVPLVLFESSLAGGDEVRDVFLIAATAASIVALLVVAIIGNYEEGC